MQIDVDTCTMEEWNRYLDEQEAERLAEEEWQDSQKFGCLSCSGCNYCLMTGY